jgi:hypothetical protein
MADALRTYSVYARFRYRRLTLCRGFTTLTKAIEFAERMRAMRFHDRERVIVVEDGTDRIVDGDGVDPRPSYEAFGSRDLESASSSSAVRSAESAIAAAISWVRQAMSDGVNPGEALRHLELARAELSHATSARAPDSEPRAG